MGIGGKPEFQEVEGTSISVKGAEDADLFLHRSVTGGGWRVSSGVNGMYVGGGGTKKAAVDDASQKGKPEAIVKQIRHYVRSGESVSPRVTPEALESYFDRKPKASVKPVNLEWDSLHKQSREELLSGAGMQLKLADKKWSELDPWIQGLLKESLKGRSSGKVALEPEPQTETISPSSLSENAAIHAYYDEHPEKDKTREGRGKGKRRGASRKHKVETQMGRVGR